MYFLYGMMALLIGVGLYISTQEMHRNVHKSGSKWFCRGINIFLWAFLITGSVIQLFFVQQLSLVLESGLLLAFSYAVVYLGYQLSRKSMRWLY